MSTNYQITTAGNGLKLADPESAEAVANSIDLTSLRHFTSTATGAGTWTFNNTPTGKKLTTTFKITLTNGGLGVQTWPTNVVWSGGVAPTLSEAGTEVLQFSTSDNGTTWYGHLLSTTAATSFIPATFNPASNTTLDVPLGNGINITAVQKLHSSSNGTAATRYQIFMVNKLGVATNWTANPATTTVSNESIRIAPSVSGTTILATGGNFSNGNIFGVVTANAPYSVRITVANLATWPNIAVTQIK